MIINNPRLLPSTIISDIKTILEYPDTDMELIMEMIKGRLVKDVEIDFTVEELKDFINEIKNKQNSEVIIPMTPGEIIPHGKSMLKKLDTSPMVNYRNGAEILRYFLKEGLERMNLLKETQASREEIIIELETLSMGYMNIMTNITEKIEKLKLNVIESGKYKAQIKEDIDKLMIIMRSVIKQNVSPEIYKKIVEDLNSVLKLYKI